MKKGLIGICLASTLLISGCSSSPSLVCGSKNKDNDVDKVSVEFYGGDKVDSVEAEVSTKLFANEKNEKKRSKMLKSINYKGMEESFRISTIDAISEGTNTTSKKIEESSEIEFNIDKKTGEVEGSIKIDLEQLMKAKISVKEAKKYIEEENKAKDYSTKCKK